MLSFNKDGRIEVKYTDIADTFKETSRFNYTGGKLNFLFEFGGKVFYFKTNGLYTEDQKEVLATIAGKPLNTKISKPLLATFTDKDGAVFDGILSPDFVKDRKNTEVVPYTKIIADHNKVYVIQSVEYIMSAVKEFAKNNKLTIDANLVNDLKLLAFYNFAIGQQDFNSSNIEFAITTDENGVKTISLLPTFDKSISLFNKVDGALGIMYISNVLVEKRPELAVNDLYYFMTLSREEHDHGQHYRILHELAFEIGKNPVLEKAFIAYANFDFEKEIEKFENTTGFKFADKHKKRAIIFFNTNKKMLTATVLRHNPRIKAAFDKTKTNDNLIEDNTIQNEVGF